MQGRHSMTANVRGFLLDGYLKFVSREQKPNKDIQMIPDSKVHLCYGQPELKLSKVHEADGIFRQPI